MKTLTHNLKIATMIPAKAYGATENFRGVDLLGLVAASNTLSIATNPTDADTIVIGSKTYTFQDTLTNVDGHVKIGANAAATQVNLVHAIMLNGGTSGTDYAAATTKHPYVVISEFATNVATVSAKSAGTDGNSIATTDTLTAAADGFSSATLTGGKDDIASCDSALVLLSIGDITGTPTSVKVKIQEANDIGFATSPTTALGGEEITITATNALRNSMQRFEVSPTKRYLRAVVTFTGGSTPTAALAAMAILSDIAVPYPVTAVFN